MPKRQGGNTQTYTTNEQIARRVYRSLKTPSDNDRTTDPILAFHFTGKSDYVLLRCNKEPEVSIKGQGQIAGEVKFFAYSEFKDHTEMNVIFNLKDELRLLELYGKGAVQKLSWNSWNAFCRWLDALDEDGVQISLKLPCLVYETVKSQKPSMQNFIVEAVKGALKNHDRAERIEP